jgi:hypothetical protein
MIPETLFDCHTKVECIDFFNQFRKGSSPQQDAMFALQKMHFNNPFVTTSIMLSLVQEQQLMALYSNPEVVLDWTAYCSILTVKQLHFVGW